MRPLVETYYTFFTDLGIGGPWMVGTPGCSPATQPLNPSLLHKLVSTPVRRFVVFANHYPCSKPRHSPKCQ